MRNRDFKQARFLLRGDDGSIFDHAGWETHYTMGVATFGTPPRYYPVLLMSGLIICEGFNTLQEAVEFNFSLIAHKNIWTGTPDFAEIQQRAGGAQAFAEIVRGCIQATRKT